MKIVQSINMLGRGENVFQASLTDLECYLPFDPTKFTGVEAVYFEITMNAALASYTGTIQLYDFTNSEVLGEISYADSGLFRLKSVDIKANIDWDNLSQIGIKVVKTGGAESARICNLVILVEQDTGLDASRKTKTHHYCMGYQGGSAAAYTDVDDGPFELPVAGGDGNPVFRLELYACFSGFGTVYFRLYDVTADEAVAGSEVSTSSGAFVLLQSDPLTLTDHEYVLQYKKTGGLYDYPQAHGAWITRVSSGFNSVWTQPISGHYQAAIAPLVDDMYPPIGYFEPAKIDGDDGLAFWFYWGYEIKTGVAYDDNLWLYNITGAGVVVGTTHNIVGTPPKEELFKDEPTMPESDSELVREYDGTHALHTFIMALYALQTENLPAGASLPADPTQPSGYHCFMSQFIRNLLAGLVPLKTPDGVNKCW